MIPADTLPILAVAYAACGCSAAGLLYWMYHRDQVAWFVKRVFKRIVSVLSYPVVVVAIALLHAYTCVLAILKYTAGRVGGLPMKKIKVTVTFDD